MIQSHRSLSNLLESLIPSFVFSHLPCPSCWQVPVSLSASLAHSFHTVEMAARMRLKAQGQVAACVPFATNRRVKMTLYKGEAALAARREVACSKLTHALIAALKRPRRVDKPDWAPMSSSSTRASRATLSRACPSSTRRRARPSCSRASGARTAAWPTRSTPRSSAGRLSQRACVASRPISTHP